MSWMIVRLRSSPIASTKLVAFRDQPLNVLPDTTSRKWIDRNYQLPSSILEPACFLRISSLDSLERHDVFLNVSGQVYAVIPKSLSRLLRKTAFHTTTSVSFVKINFAQPNSLDE